jgi:hypothetical protein
MFTSVSRSAGFALAGAALVATTAALPALAATPAGWRISATFAVKGGSEDLLSVAAASPRDAWALGFSSTKNDVLPAIKHWNGRTWTGVTIPAWIVLAWEQIQGPAGPFGVRLAASNGDAWIFASFGDGYLRLAGRRWSVGALPHGGAHNAVSVTSVLAVSNSDVWVFGELIDENVTTDNVRPYAARFDGRTWTATTVPGLGTIDGASAASAASIWAVTSPDPAADGPGGKPAVLRWTESGGWRQQPGPALPAGAALTSVLAEPGKVLAGGSEPGPSKTTKALAAIWSAGHWSVQRLPGTVATQSGLMNLTADGAGAWATTIGPKFQGQLWHLAGRRWSVIKPDFGSRRWYVLQLAAVPHTRAAWAAGGLVEGKTADGLIAVAGPQPR